MFACDKERYKENDKDKERREIIFFWLNREKKIVKNRFREIEIE